MAVLDQKANVISALFRAGIANEDCWALNVVSPIRGTSVHSMLIVKTSADRIQLNHLIAHLPRRQMNERNEREDHNRNSEAANVKFA